MSLDKAIEHGKEKRKPYYGAQAIDCTADHTVAVNGVGVIGYINS